MVSPGPATTRLMKTTGEQEDRERHQRDHGAHRGPPRGEQHQAGHDHGAGQPGGRRDPEHGQGDDRGHDRHDDRDRHARAPAHGCADDPATTSRSHAPAGRVSITEPYDRGVSIFVWRGRHVAWQRTGSGPPVVLCHGTPFSSAIWRPFADALSSDHTVYVWDMPGYGASSKAAEHAVDLGVQGELLADLVAEWGLDRPDVIAHDFGGAVSLRAHLLHGARYRSLMLVDVVAIPPVGSPFFRFVQEHPGLLAQLPAYIHEAIATAYIPTASHRGLRAEDLSELVAPWLTADGQPAFYRQIEQFDERYLEELQARLGEIDVPVRIVWGRDDAWLAPDTGRRLCELIPTASLRLVDGAGHLIHYDAPAALTDEIRVWLRTPGATAR